MSLIIAMYSSVAWDRATSSASVLEVTNTALLRCFPAHRASE